MIVVDALTKSYGVIEAVRGASFRAHDGQVTGLLGPNGAGKTTTLRMISSLIDPDSGHARVDDFDVHRDKRRARTRLGVLPDSRGLYPRLSTREHLSYFGGLHGLSRERIEKRTAELNELLDMSNIIDRRVEGFSQGERTKVAIARALVHDPSNVILDEATNGLDVMSTRAMRQVIRKLAQGGTCVLFSSHVMQEVSALCDRVVVMRSGRVVASGTPETLREQTGEANLENAFVRVIGSDQGLA